MKHTEAAVVIPLYKPELTSCERASIRQTVRILGGGIFLIELLVPEGMDRTEIEREFPSLPVRSVSDEWLGRKNGIAGYNRMMLSAEFYETYRAYEYILICHADAWVFRNDLSAWCRRGFDCVAAPWVRRGIYDLPLLKQYLRYRLRRSRESGRLIRQSLYGKVGNGGFSLRRVERFREACEKYRTEIERFCADDTHLGNEDVFWAVVPEDFRYPTEREALRFAFDTNPRYCYRLCGGALPMGCHAWSKPRMWRFWRRIIPLGRKA